MSAFYEPLAIEPPDVELLLSAHMRSILPSGVLCGRRFPDNLPVAIGTTVYRAALIIRDDGGPWPSRMISATVVGAKDADYSEVRQLAAWVAARLSELALVEGLPVAAVTTLRGPISVADNPPEMQLTADLILVGQPT